jgi:hypothetical protein
MKVSHALITHPQGSSFKRIAGSPGLTEDFLVVALRRFGETDDAQNVNFTVKYFPYQLYPEASKEGEDKYEWYKKSRYGDSEEKMEMYTTLMSAYGVTAGIDFKFGGTVANTLDAHRVIQHFQEEKGAETADKLINGIHSCRQYHDPMLISRSAVLAIFRA